ncbi:MAG: phytanoyl-CoA dioxygenase family protein [Burkholderiaceae bacterium]|nr:phytanoyl-CoA dioxygenase family protein [Burkholderiaceae bacterium]
MTISWPLLERFWQRAQLGASPADTWHEETRELQRLGIATETALQFLHFERPTWEGFRRWLDYKRADGEEGGATEDVLSAQDLAFWEEYGYLVLKQAVSDEACDAARRAIWEFLAASPDDPASWYRPHEAKYGLMLTLFDHPALEHNRRSPRIRNAYRQLYGSDAIFKTIDKVSFNPPENASFRFLGSSLHWDVSLEPPIPYRLQGLLYLTDCSAEEGAFHCVPGFQHELENWLATLPAGADPREEAKRQLEAQAVPGKAGDFVIWHQALPHCATPNRGRSPRLVQYLTYLPNVETDTRAWR